jgi:TolA-binding protein
MWLQHFTDKALPGLTLLGLALAASGCASSGPRADGAESGRTEQSAPGDPGAAEVPPEALTMYEQAVAVMASGDFLDAELRFKEFVLSISPLSMSMTTTMRMQGQQSTRRLH